MREGVEFSRYLNDRGFTIIPVPMKDQLAYGCNVLNLGDSRIVAVHGPTARRIIACPNFHGEVDLLKYDQITSMYGAGEPGTSSRCPDPCALWRSSRLPTLPSIASCGWWG